MRQWPRSDQLRCTRFTSEGERRQEPGPQHTESDFILNGGWVPGLARALLVVRGFGFQGWRDSYCRAFLRCSVVRAPKDEAYSAFWWSLSLSSLGVESLATSTHC